MQWAAVGGLAAFCRPVPNLVGRRKTVTDAPSKGLDLATFELERARWKVKTFLDHAGKGVNALALANAGALIAALTAFKDFPGIRGQLACAATLFALGVLSASVAYIGLYGHIAMLLNSKAKYEPVFIQTTLLASAGSAGLFALGMVFGIVAAWRT
jgi:hypothetical protein